MEHQWRFKRMAKVRHRKKTVTYPVLQCQRCYQWNAFWDPASVASCDFMYDIIQELQDKAPKI